MGNLVREGSSKRGNDRCAWIRKKIVENTEGKAQGRAQRRAIREGRGKTDQSGP